MAARFFLFLLLNFAALGIGSMFTNDGVSSEWYQSLSKAPWTPPGWVFGAAWTTIMICFSVYMAKLWPVAKNQPRVVRWYAWQWMLNVSWNPLFFKHQLAVIALLVIVSLTLLVGLFLIRYRHLLKLNSVWILPYFIWLLIATSLNAYIVLFN
jgi:tryptophan-rich sensory protein